MAGAAAALQMIDRLTDECELVGAAHREKAFKSMATRQPRGPEATSPAPKPDAPFAIRVDVPEAPEPDAPPRDGSAASAQNDPAEPGARPAASQGSNEEPPLDSTDP